MTGHDSTPIALPQREGPLIGRDVEVAALMAGLQPDSWLSLVGPGGIGKTQLALHTAHAIAAQGVDARWLNLAPVETAHWLQLALAKALGVTLDGSSPWIEQLSAALAGRTMLLVLDNCEQLNGCTAILDALVQPGVMLLTTSRKTLGGNRERVVIVRGLGIGADDAITDTVPPAEAMFLSCAQRVKPSFEATADDRLHIRRICNLADGMPLAIELAAAWVTFLPPRFIADQIQANLDWLSTSLGNTHQNPRTLRAVLDYFWRTLRPEERMQLQRLSVFRGGFVTDLASAIAGATDEFLGTLVDRVFLSTDEHGRYRMHELLRQYAAEKLAQNQTDWDNMHSRHAQVYAQLAERADAGIRGADSLDQKSWVARLGEEHGNLHAMLEWLLRRGNDATAAARAVIGLSVYWYQHGHVAEGRYWLERAAGRLQPGDILRAQVQSQLAVFALLMDDHEAALAIAHEALPVFKQANAAKGLASVLSSIAEVHFYRGDYAGAGPPLEEALHYYQNLGDAVATGEALHSLTLVRLANGDIDQAETFARRSIETQLTSNNRFFAAYTSAYLALVLMDRGRRDEAISVFLGAAQALGDTSPVFGATLLEVAALLLAAVSAHSVQAVTLLACAEYARTVNRLRLSYLQRTRIPGLQHALRQQIGSAVYDTARTFGQDMTMNDGLSLARDILNGIPSAL